MSYSLLQHQMKNVSIVIAALALLSGCQENTEEAAKAAVLKPSKLDTQIFKKPTQAVILEVTGKISQFNDQQKLLLDREQLLSFKQVEVKTATPWTDKLTRFKGPLLRDVLAAAGSTGSFIYAKAVNEYAVKIPISDADNFSVILAIEQDDQELTIRNKGPIWVIYPWSESGSESGSGSDELKQDEVYSRSIWHLTSMRIHD